MSPIPYKYDHISPSRQNTSNGLVFFVKNSISSKNYKTWYVSKMMYFLQFFNTKWTKCQISRSCIFTSLFYSYLSWFDLYKLYKTLKYLFCVILHVLFILCFLHFSLKNLNFKTVHYKCELKIRHFLKIAFFRVFDIFLNRLDIVVIFISWFFRLVLKKHIIGFRWKCMFFVLFRNDAFCNIVSTTQSYLVIFDTFSCMSNTVRFLPLF